MKKLLELIVLIGLIPGCKTTTIEHLYDTYPQLGFDSIESSSYELIKVADWDDPNQSSSMNLLIENKNLMIELSLSSYILIDSNGNFISSYIRGEGESLTSNLFLAKDYYIDWPLTGNKDRKKYSKRIHASTLSINEFNQYLDLAEKVIYTTFLQYESEEYLARCLLRIDGHWMVIEIELPEDYDMLATKEELSQKAFKHATTMKNEEVFYKVADEITPSYKWKDTTNPIYLEAHKRREKSYLRYSSQQAEKGWDSTGYFNLKFGGEVLKFKAFTFEWKREFIFDPDMNLYLDTRTPELAVLIVTMNKGNDIWKVEKDPKEAGIYIIRRKVVNN